MTRLVHLSMFSSVIFQIAITKLKPPSTLTT